MPEKEPNTQMENRVFWLPLLGIVAFMLLGLALVFWPRTVLGVVSPIVGVVMIFVGAQQIAHSVAMRAKLMDPAMKLLQGI